MHGLLNHLEHLGLVKPVPVHQQVEQSGEARDGGGEQEASASQDALRFCQRLQSFSPLGQMVEGAQEEDDVGGPVATREPAGVACLGGDPFVCRGGLLDVKGYRVDQVHAVAQIGKPCGVLPRPTPDVNDVEGPLGEEAADQFLRALELEGAGLHAPVQSLRFLAVLVVGADCLVDLHAPHYGSIGHGRRFIVWLYQPIREPGFALGALAERTVRVHNWTTDTKSFRAVHAGWVPESSGGSQ